MSQSIERVTPPAASSATARRRWLGLVVISLAQLMVVLDITVVNVALPTITQDLGISTAGQQWVITAYTLTFGGLLLLGGRVADYTGRRRAFLIGLLGFAAASALGGAAANMEMLLAARAAQGAFGALLAPAALSLLSTTFTDPQERGKAFAVFGAVVASGSAVGLILGGVLTTYLSWHWVLYVNVPIAAVAAAGAVAFLDESSTDGRRRYDVPGAVLATAGLAALVYGLSNAVQDGWGASLTVSMLAIGVVLLLAFVLVEARVPNPLLPLSIPLHRGRGGVYLAVLLMMTGLFGVFLFVSFHLQVVKGFSALDTGLAFLPMTGGILVTSAIASQIMTRVPPRYLVGSGLLLAAAGMALLSGLEVTSGYAADILPYLIMIGLGMGAVFPPAVNLATFGVRDEDSGAASASVNVAQMVGASLGTALLNTIAANATADYLATRAPDPLTQLEGLVEGYNIATVVGAGVLAVAGLVALLLINVRLGHVPDGPIIAGDQAPTLGDQAPAAADQALAAADQPPTATNHAPAATDSVGHSRPSPGMVVTGRVHRPGPEPAVAVLTLVDLDGRQVDRARTGPDGGYRLRAERPDTYLLVCTPDGHGGDHRPTAELVVPTRTDNGQVTRNVVLESRRPGPGAPAEEGVIGSGS